MDELIVRSLQGRLTDEDAQLLHAWRARDPANEARYRELARLWDVTAAAAQPRRRPIPSSASITGNVAASHREGHAQGSGHSSARGVRDVRDAYAARTRRREGAARAARVPRAAIAAILAGILALAGALVVLQNSGRHDDAVAVEVITGAGESALAHLPDGTVVRLGPGSRIASRSLPDAREVRLDGTAFFSVSHDATRPFVVRTDAGTVRVLGTRFRLTSRGERLDVNVVEGRVAVTSGGDDVELVAGEAVAATAGALTPVVRQADPIESFALFDGFFAFQATPLRDVAAELELRLGARIRFAAAELGDITVTAWFNDAVYDDVLEVVCRVASVQCATRDGVTWIDR